MGLPVKHRQLTPTVGLLANDPVMNSMANFNSTTMLDEGTSFVLGSCVCVVDCLGGFNSHLANPRGPEEPASVSINNVNDLANNFVEIWLSDLIGNY